MRRIASLVCLTILVVFSACASSSALRERLQKADALYQGAVTPTSIPVILTYKPAKFTSNIYELTLEDGKIKEQSGEASLAVSAIGESLIWDLKFLKFKDAQGRYYSPDLPLMEFRALTDRRGNIKEKEVSFPAFEQAKLTIGEKDRAQIEDLFVILPFPDHPIKTDDALYVPGQEFNRLFFREIDMMQGNEVLKDYERRLLEIFSETTKAKFRWLFRGTSYFEKRKVFVTELSSNFNAEDSKKAIATLKKEYPSMYFRDDFSLNAILKGYALIDSETCHLLKYEMKLNTDVNAESSFTAYVLFSSVFK